MNESEITHIDGDSAALLCALFGSVNGIIAVTLGIIFLPSSGGLLLLLFFALAAVIGAVSGGFAGIIVAELYNYLSKQVGGLKITVQDVNSEQAHEID